MLCQRAEPTPGSGCGHQRGEGYGGFSENVQHVTATMTQHAPFRPPPVCVLLVLLKSCRPTENDVSVEVLSHGYFNATGSRAYVCAKQCHVGEDSPHCSVVKHEVQVAASGVHPAFCCSLLLFHCQVTASTGCLNSLFTLIPFCDAVFKQSCQQRRW